MYIPKKYGQSKIDKCPFCQKHATAMNSQKVPVCQLHKEEMLDNLRCVCGSPLETLHGKFGVFFSCMKCGNMNLRKTLEFNSIKPKINNTAKNNEKNQAKKETTVRSDDPRYFD
ncbi:hypothetical protein HYY70_00870 [Candidatus Woesearchaeota archaeon]|nr:hypothetical protein [Candidatus Woesearchaeota archaeon]